MGKELEEKKAAYETAYKSEEVDACTALCIAHDFVAALEARIAELESKLVESARIIPVTVTWDAELVKEAFIDLWKQGQLSPHFAHEMMDLIKRMENGEA